MTGRVTRRRLLGLAPRRGPAAGPRSDALVVVFLRGGADGLTLVPPYGDDGYHRLRPSLALAAPGDRSAEAGRRCIDLDGFFGLHPGLGPLLPLYRSGRLAFVHAIGSDDTTRSHFEAQDRMERGEGAGCDGHGPSTHGGWMARLLGVIGEAGSASLSAVAIGSEAPESLRGARAVSVIESIEHARRGLDRSAMARAIEALYSEDDALDRAGREALRTARRLASLPDVSSAADAGYPDQAFGRHLREVGRLLSAGVGVQVAAVDLGGWDTHFVQERSLREPIDLLGRGLAAFARHLGDDLDRVTVLVMSEFGRRAWQNGSLGTDHGRAGVMLAMGAGVAGGRVVTEWPGLGERDLEDPGDLRVTLDYRAVLAELVARRAGEEAVPVVIPGACSGRPGVIEPG